MPNQDDGKVCVLFAEDDPDILGLLVEAARLDGRFVVETATSGEEIINKVNARCADSEDCFDAIVTDVNFMKGGRPGMTGMMATATIRRRFKDVPVLFLTADTYNTPFLRMQARQYDAEVESKPLPSVAAFLDRVWRMGRMRPAWGKSKRERRRMSVNLTNNRRRAGDVPLHTQTGVAEAIQRAAESAGRNVAADLLNIDVPK